MVTEVHYFESLVFGWMTLSQECDLAYIRFYEVKNSTCKIEYKAGKTVTGECSRWEIQIAKNLLSAIVLLAYKSDASPSSFPLYKKIYPFKNKKVTCYDPGCHRGNDDRLVINLENTCMGYTEITKGVWACMEIR